MAPSARRLKLQGRYSRELGAPVGPSLKSQATSLATQQHPMAKRAMTQLPGTKKPTGAKGSKQPDPVAKQPGSKMSMKKPAGAATSGATGKKPAGGTQGSTTPTGARAAADEMVLETAAQPGTTPTADGNQDPSGTSPTAGGTRGAWIERKVYKLNGASFTCKSVQVDYGVPGGVVRVEWMCW